MTTQKLLHHVLILWSDNVSRENLGRGGGGREGRRKEERDKREERKERKGKEIFVPGQNHNVAIIDPSFLFLFLFLFLLLLFQLIVEVKTIWCKCVTTRCLRCSRTTKSKVSIRTNSRPLLLAIVNSTKVALQYF